MIRDLSELADDSLRADFERVELRVDVPTHNLFHARQPGEIVAFGDGVVFVECIVAVAVGASGAGDEVAPAEAEDVEDGLRDGVVEAVVSPIRAAAGGFVADAHVFEVLAEDVEDVADGGGRDVGTSRRQLAR